MTSEVFAQLIVSDYVNDRIKAYRQHLPELERLRQEVKDREALIAANPDPKAEMNTRLKTEIRALKRKMPAITKYKTSLPLLMYQAAGFDETASKNGNRGCWRKQEAVRLNGLFMLDADHVEKPREVVEGWLAKSKDGNPRLFADGMTLNERLDAMFTHMGVLLVHITPSGQGLRIVAIADPGVGNIADNQARLAQLLDLKCDTGCKDASRGSFCPSFNDIIYANYDKLFTFQNNEYDEKYGPQYRGGHSQPTAAHTQGAAGAGKPAAGPAVAAAPRVGGSGGQGPRKDNAGDNGPAGLDDRLKEGYHGKAYKTICDAWFGKNGGTPAVGDRHQSLYKLACDIRYIADFDPQLLARILAECEVGADVAAERGQSELDRIAGDACALQRNKTLPKRLQAVLQDVGVELSAAGPDGRAEADAAIDYAAWWARLQPLLESSPGFREAVVTLPDHLKLAGVLAAGAMFGTYLTRCWWQHFDGKDYRLSYLVYIVGAAASGKSFLTELDRLIMSPMLASDRVGREWERQYKEDMKKRSASSKDAKAAAPDQQHPCIRYVPSSISNAMLYRRLTDATDADCAGPDGQQPMHLHIYTMEPELATALRAQQGSWAGKNDLELKSFHNEYAGVDFANDQSVNGIIQVNWNQVVTGTPESMSRKIKPSMVLDGLVTRLVLFPMPSNDFQMIERRESVHNAEREEYLRSAGLLLEQVRGLLKADRLVDYCYDYEKRLTDEARFEQDYCLDYFRKRIPVIMMRYTLVRIVLRDIDKARLDGQLEVTDDDLEFARLIGDWCLTAQMHFFGQMVMDAQEREKTQFLPKRRSTKVRSAYARMPQTFTPETLVSIGVYSEINSARVLVSRWLQDGLVEKDGKKYKKKYQQIPY